MTSHRTANQPGAGNGQPRGHHGRHRGELSRELIVTESLRLLDTNGMAGFGLPKLGRALGADPTASTGTSPARTTWCWPSPTG